MLIRNGHDSEQKHTSKAGFHHRSTRITLLQHVRFKPVLPALNEIKMTRMERLVLIFCRTASRSGLVMDPSSKIILKTTGDVEKPN